MIGTIRVAATPGEWASPIGSELVAEDSGSFGWPACSGDQTWWTFSDPISAQVHLIRQIPGRGPEPVLPAGWSVRNQVNGYGGRPYLVATTNDQDSLLVFTEFSDHRLYAASFSSSGMTSPPRALTPTDQEGLSRHYADPVLSHDGSEVWCIRESTIVTPELGNEQPASRTSRDIIAIPLNGSAVASPSAIRVVARSHHFLSGVRISPDGSRLAWIGWDHPAMPWDQSELVVADLIDGVAIDCSCVFGGPDIAVAQAEWRDSDALYAMADPDGWWNLYLVDVSDDSPQSHCVLPLQRDCADALWQVGSTWFAVTISGVVLRHGCGSQQLALWNPRDASLRQLAPLWDEFGSAIGATSPSDNVQAVAVVAASASQTSTVLRVPLPGPPGSLLGEPQRLTLPEHQFLRPWIPEAERRTAQRTDGTEVHYVYYAPTNPGFTLPDGVLPPLLVHAHGGPTGSAGAMPDLEFALFCSRGFAFASVDYGGSTGYGRDYRNRLRHNWGIVDIEDCITVARALAEDGLADATRTAIRGGSAGGWTALACLATTDVFCCGTVYYPISDPLSWSGENTHDFESRYLESLIGTLPADLDRYRAVSPAANAGKINKPLVILQGADDFICRPSQAQLIVDEIAKRGLWHRYLVFEGEGHGFRRKSSVLASLELEAELYSTAMGINVDLRPAEQPNHH
jgi:dienelactone hydrolase